MPDHNEALVTAYQKRQVPLWVSAWEAYGMVRRLHYSDEIAIELADWIARRLSLAFAAGYLGRQAPVVAPNDVVRQLLKMGYIEDCAVELAGLVIDNVSGVYRKGCQRRKVTIH